MKLFLTAAILGVIIAGAGCETNGSITNGTTAQSNANANRLDLAPPAPIRPVGDVDPDFVPCNLYFPLVPGSEARYTLNFSSGLVANVTVVVDEEEENGRKVFVERTQIVDLSGGLNKNELSVRKYVCDGGAIQLISEKTDNTIDGRRNLGENHFRNGAAFLLDPSALGKKGSNWSYSFAQSFEVPGEQSIPAGDPVTIQSSVEGTEDVRVPAGSFKALKVVRKVGGMEVTHYFAPGIGLVKRYSGEGTVLELKEYSGLTPLDQGP